MSHFENHFYSNDLIHQKFQGLETVWVYFSFKIFYNHDFLKNIQSKNIVNFNFSLKQDNFSELLNKFTQVFQHFYRFFKDFPKIP